MELRTALPMALVAGLLALALVGGPSAGAAKSCGGKKVTKMGTPGDDRIKGTNGPDVVEAGEGHDTIRGRGGNDFICTGDGDDTVNGGPGNDRIFGEDGNDSIDGDAGNEFISGGPEKDFLNEDLGDGRVVGGEGDDEIMGYDGIDTGIGGPGDDTIRAGIGFDTLIGGAGDDLLEPEKGQDIADGGPGSDTAGYAHEPGGVRVDLKKRSTQRAAGRDSLPSIENLIGSRYADWLFGTPAPNRLEGGKGNDKLVGRGGGDTILQ